MLNDVHAPPAAHRFALEVVAAVVEEIGAERVGIRLSPFSTFNDATDTTPYTTLTYLIEQLNAKFPKMAYLHMVEPRVDGGFWGHMHQHTHTSLRTHTHTR